MEAVCELARIGHRLSAKAGVAASVLRLLNPKFLVSSVSTSAREPELASHYRGLAKVRDSGDRIGVSASPQFLHRITHVESAAAWSCGEAIRKRKTV